MVFCAECRPKYEHLYVGGMMRIPVGGGDGLGGGRGGGDGGGGGDGLGGGAAHVARIGPHASVYVPVKVGGSTRP